MTTSELKKEISSLLSSQCTFFSAFSFEENSAAITERDVPAYKNWIAQGKHAEMTFLEKNLEARKDPNLVLPGVRSALVFLFPYARGKRTRGLSSPGKEASSPGLTGGSSDSLISKKLISKYIYGKDYHRVLNKKLNEIGMQLKEHLKEDFSFRAVTDSIPFFDRAYARQAALGFVGKNTMLIRPGAGSFFFITTLLTTLPVEKLTAPKNKINPITTLDCGACTKCLDACPTNALTQPYVLDAGKCLSYLTIEHRNTVPEKYIPHFAQTIYGCDICQEVCPYNLVTSDFSLLNEFSTHHEPFLFLTPRQIAGMNEIQYASWFGGTAATRAKYSGLIRNALYHLYAVSDPHLQVLLDGLKETKHHLIRKTVCQIQSLLEKDPHSV